MQKPEPKNIKLYNLEECLSYLQEKEGIDKNSVREDLFDICEIENGKLFRLPDPEFLTQHYKKSEWLQAVLLFVKEFGDEEDVWFIDSW